MQKPEPEFSWNYVSSIFTYYLIVIYLFFMFLPEDFPNYVRHLRSWWRVKVRKK